MRDARRPRVEGKAAANGRDAAELDAAAERDAAVLDAVGGRGRAAGLRCATIGPRTAATGTEGSLATIAASSTTLRAA